MVSLFQVFTFKELFVNKQVRIRFKPHFQQSRSDVFSLAFYVM